MKESDDVRVSIDLDSGQLQITEYRRPSYGQGYRDALWVGLLSGMVIGVGVMSAVLHLMRWL